MGCSAKKLKKKRQQKKSLLPCPWGGGTHCRGRCIVFGQWRFYFLFSFFFCGIFAGLAAPSPFSRIALYPLFGSEAISGRCFASCFAYKLAIVLPLLWLSTLQRCNIETSFPSFNKPRISDGLHCDSFPSEQQVSKRALAEWAGLAFQPEPQPSPCAVPHQNCMHVMPMLRHIRACPSA